MLTPTRLLLTVTAVVVFAISFFAMRAYAIQQAPLRVMATIEARVAAGAGGWNACLHNRQFGPVYGGAARANPDSIISIMAYDLTDGPVRVRGETWPAYWSLSLYQQNSDTYFVVNDRQIDGDVFDLIVAPRGAEISAPPTAQIVISPTTRGIMMIRRFAPVEADMPGILANQDALVCESFNAAQ